MTRFAEQVWVVEPGIDPAGIPGLCERFAAFVAECDGEVVVCDVGALARPDAVALSALARMQLTARRLGRGIQLHRAQRRLIELIGFAGLGGVLPLYSGLVLELGREAEQREQPVHVEEVVDPLDPPG
ncbi:MAG TPA: STAS domain-containing protein [Candidatus Limnocylindrales bacterium]